MRSLAPLLLAASITLLPGLSRAQQPDPPVQSPPSGQWAPVLSATHPQLTIRAAMPSLGRSEEKEPTDAVLYGQVYLFMDKDNVPCAALKLDAARGIKETSEINLSDTSTYILKNAADHLATLQHPLPLYFEISPVPPGNWSRRSVKILFRPVGEWRRIHNKVTSFLRDLNPILNANNALERASENVMFNAGIDDATRQQDIETFFLAVENAKKAAYDAILLDVDHPNNDTLAAQGMVHKYINDLENDTEDFIARKADDPVVRAAVDKLSKPQPDGRPPLINKDFYGLSDNYRPEVLAMAVRWTRATVSILKQGQKVGSGALIGKNLVLTCWHCVEDSPPYDRVHTSDYKVELLDDYRKNTWIEDLAADYFPEKSVNQLLINQLPSNLQAQLPANFVFKLTPSKQSVVKRACHIVSYNKDLDYCLLDIGPVDPNHLSYEEKKELPPIERITPIQIVTSRAGFMAPLYVLGYPQGGNLTVHDNSWVVFPLDIDNEERARIHRMLAQSNLPEYEPYTPETLSNLKSRYRRAQKTADEQLADHYPPPALTPGRFVRHKKGCVGLESDTFQGDSGAPVISRHLGGLIGILRRGAGDTHVATKNSSSHPRRITSTVYEEAIPIEIILNDMKQKQGEVWLDSYGISIED